LPGATNFKQIPALGERGLKMIDVFMDKLEARLKGREYVASGQFSIADITVVLFLDFARVVGKKITEANIKSWMAAPCKRPSFNL
jgi:glutathione S-transferase